MRRATLDPPQALGGCCSEGRRVGEEAILQERLAARPLLWVHSEHAADHARCLSQVPLVIVRYLLHTPMRLERGGRDALTALPQACMHAPAASGARG
jgi:hypothetical protein